MGQHVIKTHYINIISSTSLLCRSLGSRRCHAFPVQRRLPSMLSPSNPDQSLIWLHLLHLVISYLATEFIWAIDLVTSSHLQPSSQSCENFRLSWQPRAGSEGVITWSLVIKPGISEFSTFPELWFFERNQVSTRSTLHIAAIVLYRSI